jgi:hypothetical protein
MSLHVQTPLLAAEEKSLDENGRMLVACGAPRAVVTILAVTDIHLQFLRLHK